MKQCFNCKYFTGIQCHWHGEYYGLCHKNKNDLIISNEKQPCLQDINTLRVLYVKLIEENTKLKFQNIELQTYKLKYESKERTIKKYQDLYYIACKYIDKKQTKQFYEEFIEFMNNYKLPDIEIPKINI